jgi:hypothetical protein
MGCISFPFTRQVNQTFGSESSQVPFYTVYAFFAVDRKCRFSVHRSEPRQVGTSSTASRSRYEREKNYEAVARRTNLDRRTVKRYLQQPGSTPS